MAVVLSKTLVNPFNTTPGPPSCRLEGPFNFPEQLQDLDNNSLHSVIRGTSRATSPSPSLASIASAPIYRNNENVSPLSRFRNGAIALRSASTSTTESPINAAIRAQRRNFTFLPLVRQESPGKEGDVLDREPDVSVRAEPESSSQDVAQHHEEEVEEAQPTTPGPSSKHNEVQISVCTETPIQPIPLITPRSNKLTRITELRHTHTSKESQIIYQDPSTTGTARQQRLSDRSSDFVRSIKTASFTNVSFSIFPRSSRFGHSSDSYRIHGSQPRHSIDSDRPTTSYSFDDAALKRGFKRQHVIDELIATEETYVGDLKALVYLYSTLLASTSPIPSGLRDGIEHNVASILHSHEKLLSRLHTARLQAASRRWAATAMPVRLGYARRTHLRNSDKGSRTQSPAIHRHTRSEQSADVPEHHPQQSGSAEPVDVYEIAIIFKEAMREFYAYEEYCANFESIGDELQKHMPQLWSTYESGMESLARVLMAIDQRSENERRGLTVGDLLIKPVQRLTKYPLILSQLLTLIPVMDAPGTHTELDTVLQSLREVVQLVNLARDNQHARQQVQRRRLLQDRLDLTKLRISAEQFRSLGTVELCGVLHVAYQSTVAIGGAYAVCALLDEHFLVAFPSSNNLQILEAAALIQLSDLAVEGAMDGKGLQCASGFFTWKISFACAGHYHEFILSACSKIEEDQWMTGLRGDYSSPAHHPIDSTFSVLTSTALDLKSTGLVFSSQTTLSRESSVQRSATVGGRPSISQVIVRNTHNSQHLDHRDSTLSIPPINRSQSHMTAKRIPILGPKRSDRTRLENSISDIWTKERLPFPGMVGSRGGQIIRASAGSLARKLSLASIHSTFSRGRTSSLSMASRNSHDLFNEAKSTFEIRKCDQQPPTIPRNKPKDIPEVDDMRSVVGRMIGNGFPATEKTEQADRSWGRKTAKGTIRSVGPNDSAAIFYETATELSSTTLSAGKEIGETPDTDIKRKKPRWSRPISKLKTFGSEAKNMFNTNSSGI